MHIVGRDVAELDNHAFRRVLNSLLTVEANENGVPLDHLELTSCDSVADAGIDARVRWPTGAPYESFAPGINALQFKSGKIKRGEIEEEFNKAGVQQTLRSGGSYLLLVGHDYVSKARDEHRKELARLCRAKKLRITRCKILYGDQIARWASRYWGVMCLPEFGKRLGGLLPFERWKQDPLFADGYFADAGREEIITAVRNFVRAPGDDSTLRIEGLAGVGKTRLVLEALSQAGTAEAAVYAPNAEDRPVLDLLADASGQGIVVADECTRDRQAVLMQYARSAGPRLRLICVGPAETIAASHPGLTKVYRVDPLAESGIRAVLGAARDQFPQEIIATAVRVSAGYVKLALFVARILLKRRVPLVELRRIDDVRQILKRFVPRGINLTLQALSLLSRVGWEEEIQEEAKALANAIGLGFHEMQRAVRQLKDQGVVLPRGRYLYVSPDLLAIQAAAELWDERGARLIQIVVELPGPQPRRNLLMRLAMMGEHAEVRTAVERLLGDDGLFKTIEDLDEEFLSEVFHILSAALPRVAVERLKTILLGTPRSRLLGFKTGRRNVMWALESLLRRPETSIDAARCVRELALAETESIANNATGIFAQYFQLFLSGSSTPFFERFAVIDELVKSCDPVGRMLAIKAAAAALTRNESRCGADIDPLSLQPYPKEWRPRSIQELHEARRSAVGLLRQLASGSDEVSSSARQELVKASRSLVLDGALDDAVRILESVEPQSTEEARTRADAAGWILQCANDGLTVPQRTELERLLDSAFGDGLLGQLKRWIGRRLHVDFDPSGGTLFASAERNVLKLASTAYEQGLTDQELTWLNSREAENVWQFGKRLGELDAGRKYLDRITSTAPNDVNCVFLSAYVAGLASVNGDAAWDGISDLLAESRPLMSLGVTCRGPATSAAGRRVLKLMDEDIVPVSAFNLLMYGGWVASLPAVEKSAILDRLLEKRDGDLTVIALSILHDWAEKEPEAADPFECLVWRALEEPLTISRFNSDWYWGELAKAMATRDPRRAATLAIGNLVNEALWVRFQDTGRAVLEAASAVDTDRVFDVVSRALLDDRRGRHRLLFALEHWYGDLVSPSALVDWARAHPPLGASIAAGLITVESTLMPERLRALLKAFPGDEQLWKAVLRSLATASWFGPYSGRLQREREILQGWLQESDPSLRRWVADAVRRTDLAINRQLRMEEEESISELAAADASGG